MSEVSSKCNRCGAPLPPDAPEGLCPRCLVALNLATQTEVPGETGPPGNIAAKPPPAPPLPPAEVAKLFPQLEILECLGRGGMGAVYKARQPRLDRLVALKILSPEKQDDPKFAERFEREARALARLSHPNIVTVYDFGQVQGNCYLLMEFVDGLTLRQLFHTRKLAPAEALNIVPKICEALQYAHNEGIVHRDIKPENILLDKKGQVKIADFGIAKIIGQTPQGASLTGAKDVVGTPHYMAPEQIEKPQTVDHRADIYSLGVVFYEMLTGELPLGKFQPPSSCSRGMQIDVRLDEVVLHALEKQPERRYQQASQVKTAVETIAATTAPGSSRRLPGRSLGAKTGEEAPSSQSEIEPRISRTAIVGASLAPFFFIAAGLWLITYYTFQHRPLDIGGPSPLSLLAWVATPFGLMAPFVTTILGWIAMLQIRRSRGRLYGLGLAVFDGLLFPLLALDSLIIGGFLLVMKILRQVSLSHARPWEIIPPVWANYWWLGLAALLASVLIDFLIIRQVWRAVKKTVAISAAPPVQKPDHFWRGFAMAVLALISIPIVILIVIAILGLLAAIAIPNFARARRHAQEIHQQSEAMRREGLIARWSAEGTARDSMGHNDGMLMGNATFSPGLMGLAFKFDGNDSYVKISRSPGLEMNKQLTVEFWMKADPDNKMQSYQGLVASDFYGIEIANGFTPGPKGVEFFISTDSGAVVSPSSFPDTATVNGGGAVVTAGQWHHVAGTYDGTKLQLYIDGEPHGAPCYHSGRISTMLPQSFMTIGSEDGRTIHPEVLGPRYFKGLVDEVGIYNRALPASEIKEIFQTGSSENNLAAENRLHSPPPASAETWSPTLAPGEKPDLKTILDEAKTLMEQSRYEDALQRHLWYFNHALEYDQAQTGVRLSFALSQWVELGRRYPKAKEALIEIRDRDVRMLAEGKGYANLFTDVQAINRELQDENATYELFKTIREKDPQLAGQCYFWIESLLVAKGEYQWCYDHMGDPQFRFDSIRRSFDMERANHQHLAATQQQTRQMIAEMNRKNGWTNVPSFSPPDTSAMLKKSAEDRFVGQTRQLIEILVATGHQADAEKIRGQAVAILDDTWLKSAVSDAEHKIGK